MKPKEDDKGGKSPSKSSQRPSKSTAEEKPAQPSRIDRCFIDKALIS